jgi:hypothetical protein
LLKSKDAKTWTVVAGSPSGLELCLTVGDGKVYMADFYSGKYFVADETDLSHWTSFPAPFTVGGGKQGPIFLEFDEAHHILYSSNFTGGLWRVVVQASATATDTKPDAN